VPNDLNEAKRLNGLNDLNGFFLLLLIVMRKAFKDADFHRDYKKLTGEDLDSLIPEKDGESDQGNAARRRLSRRLAEQQLFQ
jgi:hypothetical protein